MLRNCDKFNSIMSSLVTSNTTESTNNKIIELQGMNQTLNSYLIDLKMKVDNLMTENVRIKESTLTNSNVNNSNGNQ